MAIERPASDVVNIVLSRDEALVLDAWLNRVRAQLNSSFEDQSEQRVLWDLECLLEAALAEPLCPDYATVLAAARSRVRDKDA